jgi:hypothetical protein
MHSPSSLRHGRKLLSYGVTSPSSTRALGFSPYGVIRISTDCQRIVSCDKEGFVVTGRLRDRPAIPATAGRGRRGSGRVPPTEGSGALRLYRRHPGVVLRRPGRSWAAAAREPQPYGRPYRIRPRMSRNRTRNNRNARGYRDPGRPYNPCRTKRRVSWSPPHS